MTKPYNLMLHYDATAVTTVMVGTGALMHPICGQSEEIGVTNRTDLVECSKCKHIIEKENIVNKTWTTEPGCYTEPHLLVDVPTEVLIEVRTKAYTAHMQAGGHGYAARMARVVELVDTELESRPEPAAGISAVTGEPCC